MTELFACLLVLVAIVSLVPANLHKGYKCLALYYPILALGLYFAYDTTIRREIPSENVPIRIDLLILDPIVAFILATGITRWALFAVSKATKNPSALKGKQVLITMVYALACFIWFFVRW